MVYLRENNGIFYIIEEKQGVIKNAKTLGRISKEEAQKEIETYKKGLVCVLCGCVLDRRFHLRDYCVPCFKVFRAQQKEEWRQYNKDYLKQQRYDYTRDLKLKIIAHYTNGDMRCSCCGEDDVNVLTIDHINNDGNNQRLQKHPFGGYSFYCWIIKNGYPSDLQIICMNCNSTKSWSKNMEYRRNKYKLICMEDLRYTGIGKHDMDKEKVAEPPKE